MIYLYENSCGYALFNKIDDKVELLKTYNFKSSEESVDSYKELLNNELPNNLKDFLILTLKNKNDVLCVRDDKLSSKITSECDIKSNFVIDDTFKEIRNGIEKYFTSDFLYRTLYLSHKLSMEKININSDKIDTMVIQSINLLLDLDKDINLHCMRIREWYGIHFPELSLLIDDNLLYLQLVLVIKRKNSFTKSDLLEIVDEDLACKIHNLSENSMGADITDLDIENIVLDSKSVIKSFEYRTQLSTYIKEKMAIIAPNLTNLMGDLIGARLIAKAGSLDTLAKFPSSTVQLLGAEKSLFQSLRNKTNTPKYGIIFDSSIVGYASTKNKGKVARSLASKISLCARIDSLGKDTSGKFGVIFKEQIYRRVKNLENRNVSKKKIEVKGKFIINADKKYDGSDDTKRIKKN
ncbi:nucleolar protein 58 [Trichonephila clavata]|uniref:Nucleolar protein 58 n=1 Tax=Trichonephila clavata TaxID=2740835 RepID=A0A8X6JVS9_TRICU|nr:nucleolar protein 58 [Trichonephila clavata]